MGEKNSRIPHHRRQLPDGTMQRSPDVMGLLTYTKSHRNFNVIWKDAKDTFFSYSLVSTYKLTLTEYSETIVFSILNDQIGGKEISYDLSGPTRSVPVNVEGGRIQRREATSGDSYTARSTCPLLLSMRMDLALKTDHAILPRSVSDRHRPLHPCEVEDV
jgi:hypothetical protein